MIESYYLTPKLICVEGYTPMMRSDFENWLVESYPVDFDLEGTTGELRRYWQGEMEGRIPRADLHEYISFLEENTIFDEIKKGIESITKRN
jgi:hypothetical protein